MSDSVKPMNDDAVVALVREAIENSREDVQRRAVDGTTPPSSEVQHPAGITIDLGHRNIQRLPDEVIDIIKDEIERLAISHNSVSAFPLRIAECTRLRYLNVRYNAFREFPTPILQLTALEILDISNNRLQKIPDEISNLSSLKVLAISRNRIERLPTSLGDITSLRMLKFDKNRLLFPPPEICSLKEDSPTPADENEREATITSQIKKYLRQQSVRQKLQVDSEGEGDERDAETPRPPKRIGSGRFPVRPSIGGMDALTPESPLAPPIPQRSHYRGQSAQTPREPRPMVSPLVSGNDRNRSQSESVMPGTAVSRTKRLGIVPPRGQRTPVDENRPLSHARGLSHGSLPSKTNGTNGVQPFPAPPASASLAENGELDRQRNLATTTRLSGVLEHKRRSRAPDGAVEAAKGVRFAIAQIHQPLTILVSSWKRGGSMQKGELQRRMNQSHTLTDELGRHLQEFDTLAEEDEDDAKKLSAKIKMVCSSCIKDYMSITQALTTYATELVRYGDPRIVRSLLLLLYGSTQEVRNACAAIGIKFANKADGARNSRLNHRSVTPTQSKLLASRRMRTDSNTSQGYYPAQYAINPLLESNPNSRSNTLTSIVSATPRSGESFPYAMTRSNTMQSMDFPDEEAKFDNIFLKLQASCQAAEDNLPSCQARFEQSKMMMEMDNRPDMAAKYQVLSRACGAVIDAARLLTNRLSTVQLKDPRVRRQLDFWQPCWMFINSWLEYVACARDPSRHSLIPVEVKAAMKPIQKNVKEASQSIATSPWSTLLNNVRDISNGISSPAGQLTSNHAASLSQNSNFSTTATLTPNTSFTSQTSNGTIPTTSFTSYGAPTSSTGSSFGFPTPVPATPLSAALGPAAFATVPTTPGQGSNINASNGNMLPVPGMGSVDLGIPSGPHSQLNWLARADALLQQQGGTVKRGDQLTGKLF